MGKKENSQLELAFNFVQFTNKNIFLTGKAGTGKTTFLHSLKKSLPKRMIVVAPTGVAAINAGGVTIHSFFQLPFGPYIPGNKNSEINPQNSVKARKFSKEKRNIIKTLDLLIIDEISMVRADMLDGIDEVLRQYKNRAKPFGGVQLLMIGDLQQLAPVIKEDEKNILREYYDILFFFGSKALQQTNYISIELKHIYRQSDPVFVNLLNKVRDNKLDQAAIEELNKCYIPNFEKNPDEGYIILTTHNAKAQTLNNSKLEKLQDKEFTYKATVQGDFPEYTYPVDANLVLKKGAQVMFIKNDSSREKLYYNGKIGIIESIDNDSIFVKCPNEPDEISVEITEWHNIKYSINSETKEIQETIAGTYIQYPLKLAWAITIHKSQGLTFEKAIIDANMAFAHGQVYVALSRCKNLEGLVLSSPINPDSIKSNFTVSEFTQDIEQNPPDNNILDKSKKEYERTLLLELFDNKPLQYATFSCVKIANENKSSIQGNFFETINKISTDIQAEITRVSEKFKHELLQLIIEGNNNIEENTKLQGRLTKASAYFEEKIQRLIISPLQDITAETDNKTISKSIKNATERLTEESKIKMACYKACINGFTIKNYLQTQAKAAIDNTIEKKKPKKHKEVIPDTIEHPILYNTIKSWRNQKADEQNVPVYMILPLMPMKELTYYLPGSLPELHAINGIGKKKVEQFGDEILEIIENYCTENNVQKPQRKLEISAPPNEKIDTKKISFDLLKEGNTIEEVASERDMIVRTIEGHIAHYISSGDLNILEFVTPEKISLISEYFLSVDDTFLGPAKEILGDDVSYRELNFVLKHLEYTGKLE